VVVARQHAQQPDKDILRGVFRFLRVAQHPHTGRVYVVLIGIVDFLERALVTGDGAFDPFQQDRIV
jgi:hypothetical protein